MGWSANTNGVLMVANMVTLILMFTVSLSWGRINDAISVAWILSFLPLAALLVQVNQPVMGRGVSVAVALIGGIAMLIFAVLQALLVIEQVRFEQTLGAVMTLGGVLGLWLLLNGLLALQGKTLPAGLAWLGFGYGLSYVIAAAAFWTGGYGQPVLWTGAAVGFLVGPVWSFWLGRLLLGDGSQLTAVLLSAG
jgi:hypothetical protein